MSRIIFATILFQTSSALALPPVPIQYRYPSLVCGKQLPVPSPTAQAALSGLYSQCITSGFNQPGNYSADLTKTISQTVFSEPRDYIKNITNATAYTILCAFFGGRALDYVNCGYKLSAQINYRGDTCSTSREDASLTSIFGPNKASFTIEQRSVFDAAIGSVIQRLKFNGKGWFAGMIQGFEKARMLKGLNCDSSTVTQAQTTTLGFSGSETFSNSVLSSETLIFSETASNSLSASVTQSVPETGTRSLVATVTSLNSASKSDSQTLTKTLPTSCDCVCRLLETGALSNRQWSIQYTSTQWINCGVPQTGVTCITKLFSCTYSLSQNSPGFPAQWNMNSLCC